MSLYTHLSTEERELSMVLKAQGYNISQIAKKLGKTVHQSAVNLQGIQTKTAVIQPILLQKGIIKDERTADVSLFFKQMKT